MQKLILSLVILFLALLGSFWWIKPIYAGGCNCGMTFVEGGWNDRTKSWDYGGWECNPCKVGGVNVDLNCGPGEYPCNRGCCKVGKPKP